jgi:PAS domain S-box-containing protein
MMKGEDFDHHLNALEQRFQALRDQAGGWPEAREALAPALREVAQAIAELRAAQEAEACRLKQAPGVQREHSRQQEAVQGRCEIFMHHDFEALPDLLTVIDRDFNIVMSNWPRHDYGTEAERRSYPKCYRIYAHRDNPCEFCQVREVFAIGLPYTREWRDPVAGGFREIYALPILDEAGHVVLVAEHGRDIQGRKEKEAALADREEFYRALTEKSLAGVYLIQDDTLRYVNPVLAQSFGYSQEEIIERMSPRDLIHPDDHPLLDERIRQRLVGEVERTHSFFRGRRRDGSVIHIEALGRRVDYQGRPAIIGMLLDITERQRAEEALRDSEEKYRGLIETTGTGYVIIDPDGKVLDANPEYVRISGHDKLEEILGRSVIEWTAKGDRDRNAAEVKQCFQNGSVKSLELNYQKKDGRLIPVEINATVITTSEGLKVLSLVRDITERKQAQEALQTQARVLESMAEAVTGISEDGQIVFANPAAYTMFGYPEGELTGQPVTVLNDLPPEENERFAQVVIEHLQKEGTWTGEVQNRTKDGISFITYARITTLDLPEKKLWIAVQEDITARKHLEKATKKYLQFIQLLMETIPNPIFYEDTQGIILGCNKAFAEHAGVPQEEIPGKTVYDLSPGEVARICDAGAREALQHPGTKVRLNLQMPAGAGSQRQMVCQKAAFMEDSGSIGGVVSVLTDITELQRAQEALRGSEARYRTLFETSPNGIVLMDLQMNITMANQRGLHLFGFSNPEDVLARNGMDFIAPEDQPLVLPLIQEMFETGESRTLDVKLLTKDGTRVSCLVTASFLRDAAGEPQAIMGVAQDISDLKRAEEAVRESEARLRAIFEHAPVGITMVDPEGRFLQTNPAFQAIVGYNAAELQSLTCPRITHPEDLPEQLRLHRELLAGQLQFYSLEKRYLRKDGEVVWVNMMMAHLHNAQGESRAVATTVDITARKRAEEALRESEQRFRDITENAAEWVWEVDARGKYTYSSAVVEQLLGYKPEEILGRHFYDFILPDQREELKNASLAMLATKQPFRNFLNQNLHRNGQSVWLSTSGIPILDDQGNLQGYRGSDIDITAQRQAEEALRESEQRFRLMAETIQDAFWIGTPDLENLIYLSPAYEQITGQSCQEVYQSPRSFLKAIHPEDQCRVKSEIEGALGENKVWSLEYRIINPDGSVRWVLVRGYPVQDDQGRVILFTGIITDITERKTLEQQLLLAQKMEAVGRLAGGVAHDFNNLLMAITGYSELMKTKVLKGDPRYGYLEDILKTTDRAAALTGQLLTFSRRQIVCPQMMDLNRVVLDLERMLRRLIEADIDLKIITAPKLGAVQIDAGHLNQIIMNLVINARDAMPCGGRITVETAEVDFDTSRQTSSGLAQPGSYVMLQVSDTGMGMDEAIQAHIFEPFFTTKEPGKGTGLGLSTVYGIVKQSGGFIDLDSEPGRGSTFTIYLPRLVAVTEKRKVKVSKPTQFRGIETVLLVEDEDVLRTLLAKFLRLHGYTVLDARNGGEALLICEQHQGPIHLMVTDVVMPQMSGRVLADRLTPLRPEMKVLYMSGYTEDEVVQRGVAEKAVAFLQKPFKPIDLVHQVHTLLQPKTRR